MKESTVYLLIPLLVLPAVAAYLYGLHAMQSLFPGFTLFNLGGFYVVGFLTGLAASVGMVLYLRGRAGR